MFSVHHIHLRKRIFKHLEEYPSTSQVKRLLDRAIYAAAILTPVALLPQVVQVYITQDASSLSLSTWGLLTGIGLMWLLYGLVHRELPLILTHTGLFLIHIALIVGILLY